MVQKSIAAIKDFSTAILENTLSHSDVEVKINEIHTFIQEITSITGFETKIEYLAAVPASKGKALGLNHAAQCLLDYKRTAKFVKSIIQAIRDNQKKYPKEVINVFYAGCGPYATLFTLIAPLFSKNEIQFTLLEINKQSLDSAELLIQSLGLNDRIKEVYVADAVTFKVPNPNFFHILISETLDAVLYRECYVPILDNLLPQFNDGISVIPENVILSFSASLNTPQNQSQDELNLGTVLNVREEIKTNTSSTQFSDKKIDLSQLKSGDYNSLILDTKVHIYNSVWLDRNESSLTLPYKIENPLNQQSIIFTYFLEPEVELKCRFE